MSSCAVCGVRSEWDTKGLRTWLHKEDGKRDHIVESAYHPDHYEAHPDGLAYVVQSEPDVLSWVTNTGQVTHIEPPAPNDTAPWRVGCSPTRPSPRTPPATHNQPLHP